jgi:hypothetical protein
MAYKKILFRRDTAANWTSANPTLSSGEVGFETNTGKFKIGDGTTAWTSLAYTVGQRVGTTDNVTFNNLVVSGDLTVSGNTTTLNTATLSVEDNIVILNSGVTGSPSLNSGIEVERGDSTNVVLRWNESTDKWQVTENGTDYYDIINATSLEARLGEEHWHKTARLATAAVLPNTPSYTAGTLDLDGGYGIGATLESSSNARLVIDGTNANTTDRVLVKNQANAAHNGVYDVTAQGSAGSHWILTRASDMNGSHAGQIKVGESVGVREGTNNYYQQFSISTTGTGTGGTHIIGTDDITFVQYSGTASFNAGNGLTVTGNTLNVVTADSGRIFVGADSIDLAAINQNDSSGAPALNFIASITRDGYGRVLGVTTGDVQLTLGTNTTGSYVASLVAGTGVTLANNSGESATPTVSIGQAVGTTSNVTFSTVTANLTGNVTGDVSGNAGTATKLATARNIAGNPFDGTAAISIAPTDLTGVTASAAEINTLDGITASTAELNILDGVTSSTAELNILDGVTASAAELNILDGATLSTTELNYVDGVTSAIQTQLDNKASATASPVITLGGDLTGSVTLTNLGNGTLTATIASNSVALGTDTTGNYVNDITAGTGVTVTHTPSEGSSPTVAIGQAVGTASEVTFAKVTTTGNVVVGGDLEVTGTTTTVNQTSLAIEDPLIYLNDGSTISNPDLGFAGNYNDGTYRHAGLFADASDGQKFKFFKGLTVEPTTPINTAHASYAAADVVANTFESTVTTGTAPFTVASTTVVTNLNADLLDGQSSAYYAPVNNASFTGTFSAPSGTITSSMIADGTIVDGDINSAASIALSKLADVVTNAQTASYTLVLGDRSKIVEMGVGSANTLTIPPASSVNYPIGTQINVLQTGSGQTTITPGAGVTVNGTPGLKVRAQWSYVTLIKRASDTWVAVGDLSA